MKKKQTIDHQLDRAELAIEGTLGNPDILKVTAGYGFDRKRMLEGQSLLRQTRTLISVGSQKKREQKDASKALKRDSQLAWKTYVHHVAVARLMVDIDSGLWKKLQLGGARKSTYAGWLEQAGKFYNDLLQDEASLTMIKFSPEEMAQAQAMIEAVRAARQIHKNCKGHTQHSTKAYQQSLTALNAWVKRFFKVANVALEDQKQMLEALGMVVKG